MYTDFWRDIQQTGKMSENARKHLRRNAFKYDVALIRPRANVKKRVHNVQCQEDYFRAPFSCAVTPEEDSPVQYVRLSPSGNERVEEWALFKLHCPVV